MNTEWEKTKRDLMFPRFGDYVAYSKSDFLYSTLISVGATCIVAYSTPNMTLATSLLSVFAVAILMAGLTLLTQYSKWSQYVHPETGFYTRQIKAQAEYLKAQAEYLQMRDMLDREESTHSVRSSVDPRHK